MYLIEKATTKSRFKIMRRPYFLHRLFDIFLLPAADHDGPAPVLREAEGDAEADAE